MLHDYHYYLGPWVWASDLDDGDRWEPPAGCIAAVDLRGLPTQELAGGYGDRPYGFFATIAPLDTTYAALGRGDCREIAATGTLRDTWEALLGYRPAGDWLVDLVWDQLTTGSDPTGDTPTSPLMPTVGGQLELHLPGHSLVRSEAFVWGKHPHTARVRDVLQRAYREAARDEARKGGRIGQARRVLDFWREKFRLQGDDWKELVPPAMRRNHPGLLPHETTIADSFTRPDADALGSSSEGWSWTEVAGDLDIASNALACGATTSDNATRARAEVDLSSSDHYAQLSITVRTDGFDYYHPAVRFSASASTLYHGGTRGNNSPQSSIRKVVTGTTTNLVTGTTTGTPTFTSKLTANGSGLELFKDGASILTVTDTSIASGLRTGVALRAAQTTGRAVNFLAADLAVSVARQFLILARMKG